MAPVVARIGFTGLMGAAAVGSGALISGVLAGSAAQAGPVVCTTTLEAPPPTTGSRQLAAPVEVTRCATVQTTTEVVERRFFSYTSPYARGIDLTHQITDLFGIAMGGGDGTKVMGFGFPDQTIVWDGSALQNTYQVLLEEQSNPMPWRTGDVASGFSSSLGSGGASTMATPWQDPSVSYGRPVRGLW
jgi:hypothetical protein